MNNEHDKSEELFRQMADKLRGHAEPYRDGAWERFAKDSGITPRAKRKVWPYWAAAALLVGVSLVVLLRQPTDSITQQYAGRDANTGTEVSPNIRPIEKESPILAVEHPKDAGDSKIVTITAGEAGSVIKPVLELRVALKEEPVEPSEAFVELDTVPVNQVAMGAEPAVLTDDGSDRPVVDVSAESGVQQSNTLAAADPSGSPFGAGHPLKTNGYEQEERNRGAADDERRWNLAVVVSPSLTSEKINMGGGIALAYRISDKLSISSGVSIAEMGVGQYPAGSRQGERYASYDYTVPQSTPTATEGLTTDHEYLGNSYLTSVTSSLLAMDVPLDLRYHLSDRFYSSVGMSLFAVLDERRTVHYTTTTMSQDLNGTRYNRHEFTQRATHHPIESQGVGGFVNFSVGHRVPLSKRVSLSVEPYFKVPMGSLSKQDMNLNHGGLKIVTGF